MTTETPSTTGNGNSWMGAALFAIAFETLGLLVNWSLFGGPRSMESITTLKVTANVGVPSLQPLFDAAHQFGATGGIGQNLGGYALLVAIVAILLATLGNAYYISLLARSQRSLPGTAGQDVVRSYGKLVLWMVTQALFMGLMVPIIAIFGVFGGLISVVLMLWFRYHFLFFEYTLVVEKTRFTETFKRSVELRAKAAGRVFPIFLLLLFVNALLAFLLNAFFSIGAIVLLLPINVIILTMIQNRLLRTFFDARDR